MNIAPRSCANPATAKGPSALSDDNEFLCFLDESGNPCLSVLNENHGVFNLTAVLVRKEHYLDTLVPAWLQWKERWIKDPAIVFHETALRHRKPPFERLNDRNHQQCTAELTALIGALPIAIIATTIRKHDLLNRYQTPHPADELALRFCIERIDQYLTQATNATQRLDLIFESRGTRVDRQLARRFAQLVASVRPLGRTGNALKHQLRPVFLSKRCNVVGLQTADCIARPLAITSVKPDAQRRFMKAIEPALWAHKGFPELGKTTYGKTRVNPLANSRQASV